MGSRCSLYSLVAWACLFATTLFAQAQIAPGTFELSVPGLQAPSIAKLSANELLIREPSGNVTRYARAPRYDTADDRMLGYSSRQAQQIIRWPVSNAGPMQIGTLNNGRIQFAWSKMTIAKTSSNDPPQDVDPILPPGMEDSHLAGRPSDRTNAKPSPNNLLSLPSMTPMQLAVGSPNERQFLSLQDANQFGFSRQATGEDSAWYIAPVSNNMVRLQQRYRNQWLAIGLDNADGFTRSSRLNHRSGAFGGGAFPKGGSFGGGGGFRPHSSLPALLSPIHNGPDQLWRILPNIGNAGYCFESVLYPGNCLTCLPNQGLILQPITYDPWQIWWPQAPTFVLPQPQFRTVQHEIIPNPPLPPINARIYNSHSDAILVLVADRRNSQSVQKLRIPPRGSETVALDRDAGATIMETVETLDAFGNWNQQRYNTPIPPSVLYDMSVYEEFLQSIAIDRTGTSPNPIEDINYQPRSIGFFLVPPGDELSEYTEIDAYRIAEDSENPGAVRKLKTRDLEAMNGKAPASDPLKEMLNQFQKQRAAF